jgi:hypothetical protein
MIAYCMYKFGLGRINYFNKEMRNQMPDPYPDRSDISDYLESSDIIDYDHPLITNAVQQLTYGLKDNISKARAIYEFTRDHIFYSYDINANSVTITASEVFDKGHGICFAKSHLLAALMRAADIPAGFCYQLIYDNDSGRLIVHGINAVYIDEMEKWVRLDSCHRVAEEDLWACDPFKESTVRPINSELGEKEDLTVYHAPKKKIIKALMAADSLEVLKDLIPAKL